MAYDLKSLELYVLESSGTTHYSPRNESRGENTWRSKEVPKKNCENCGSNQIEENECKHCGTWYGYGHKPKKQLPIKPPPPTDGGSSYETFAEAGPKGIFRTLIDLIRKHFGSK